MRHVPLYAPSIVDDSYTYSCVRGLLVYTDYIYAVYPSGDTTPCKRPE
jgi:hypothetical protein